jgi:hypothetical protein
MCSRNCPYTPSLILPMGLSISTSKTDTPEPVRTDPDSWEWETRHTRMSKIALSALGFLKEMSVLFISFYFLIEKIPAF